MELTNRPATEAEKLAASGHSCEALEAEGELNKVQVLINTNIGATPVRLLH